MLVFHEVKVQTKVKKIYKFGNNERGRVGNVPVPPLISKFALIVKLQWEAAATSCENISATLVCSLIFETFKTPVTPHVREL